MPRHYLFPTPEGLKALQARQLGKAIQGPHGFISTEVVFQDALAAHQLLHLVRALFEAGARIYRESKVPRRKISKQSIQERTAALLKAQDWR